jgi:hypothetical protein
MCVYTYTHTQSAPQELLRSNVDTLRVICYETIR